MPAAEAYDIMVTVVNPEPEKLHLNWDLPEAVQGNELYWARCVHNICCML
jgi:hypothetical protein